jgi:hypothetical protein
MMKRLISFIREHGFEAHQAPDEDRIEIVLRDSEGSLFIERIEPSEEAVKQALGY